MKNIVLVFYLGASLYFIPLLALAEGGADVFRRYVSPQGDDSREGSAGQPFATLEKARDALRSRPRATAAEVILLPGVYYRDTSFRLSETDGGTAASPVIYKALKADSVRLIGGKRIKPSLLKPVSDPSVLGRLQETARGKVLSVTLDQLGVPPPAPIGGVFAGNGGLFSLYENDEMLPLARWPNEGFATIREVLDSGITPARHGGTFRFREDRPAAWAKTPRAEGWWLEGYWRVPWVKDGVQVESVNPSERTITLAAPVPSGIGSKYSAELHGTRKGDGRERYLARNILEELDQPGEWVYSFPNNTVYLWPRGDVNSSVLTIVYSKEPVVSVKGASHLHLESLGIEGGLMQTVRIEGGDDVLIAGCQVRNGAGNGIEIKGGVKHRVLSCTVFDMGAFGIQVEGGDRKTLTPGEFQIINNHVHHYGVLNRTVSGIEIRGVGHHVANNLLHDSPYGGFLYGGNDHLIELNEVHNIGLEGGDLGAFYTGADWTSWGNLIRYNFVHHAGLANGVYLDDGDCGDEVVGNLFYKIACGPFIGGGSMNRIRNNFIVDCKVGIHMDDRGVSRKYGAIDSSHRKKAAGFDLQHEPWVRKYPDLAAWYSKEDLGLPSGNQVKQNVMINCAKGCDNRSGKENRKLFLLLGNLEFDKNPGFANPEMLDFTMDPKNPLFAAASDADALQPIPFGKIGLYKDAWRTSLPTDESTGRLRPRTATFSFDSNTDVKKTNQDSLPQKGSP